MLNKATLIGRLGRDPEIRHPQDGKQIATFSIATSERYMDKSGERQEKTEWHKIVVFGKTADIVEKYVGKATQLYIEGKLQSRKWEDITGADRYTTEIAIGGYGTTLQMLDTRNSNGASKKPQATKPEQSTPASEAIDDVGFDDDIPF